MIELGQDEVERLNWFGIKPFVAKTLAWAPVNAVVQLAARTILPRRIGRRLPVSRRYVDYALASGQSVRLIDPLHDLIAKDIYWGGAQPTSRAERNKLKVFELLCRDAKTVIDIGAYGAFYCVLAARANPDLRAIGYEIVPQNYIHSIRNVLENNVADRVEVRLCGIGDSPGVIRLPISIGRTSFMTSISLGSKFDSGISIPVRTLDAESEGLLGPCVVKIDVEGFEDKVFQGAGQFIRDAKPDIICEILPDAHAAAAMIDEMLRPLGYRTFAFEDGGAVEYDKITPHDVMRDWLFSASERIDSVLAQI